MALGGRKSNEGLQQFDNGGNKRIVIGDQKVRVEPDNRMWKTLFALLLLALAVLALLLALSSEWARNQGVEGLFSWFFRLTYVILHPVHGALVVAVATVVVVDFLVWLLRLKPPRFDRWVRDIAKKRLSTEAIFFRGRFLFITYDVGMNKNEIMDFIREISDKSEHFTYYLDNVDIDNYTVTVEIARKEAIPKRCEIDPLQDKLWNFVPLGRAVNNDKRCVSDIGWYLNDEQVAPDAVPVLPSTSLVVAGGTGSGKSVLENSIIGHATRHHDRIQMLLADVKRVEFGGLEQYHGVHKVALTVEEVDEMVTQVQEIMMDRFKFMEEHGVNNIFKLKADVGWFEIPGPDGKSHQFQFDEIMQVTVDGERKLMTADKVYEAISEGHDVELDESSLDW